MDAELHGVRLDSDEKGDGRERMSFWSIIVGILTVIGLVSVVCCAIVAFVFARSGEEDDEWHRMEDEEQIEYIRKWRESHEKR